MKIRLGNDIRLKVQLPIGSDEDKRPSRIINARAFFVNSTLKEQLEKEYIKKNRFIGRFPIEPFVNEFQPTPYNINNSGFPKYRAFVHNEYCGFGINPNWKRCFPFADKNITTYESKVEYDADGTKITVTLPAEAQLYPGEYSLIVIGNIYDEGYSGNKRTITIDQNKLFELVKTSEEAGVTNDIEIQNNPVYIEITNSDSNLTPQDIYVTAGTYGNDAITLSRNDSNAITVDVSPITGWYEGL